MESDLLNLRTAQEVYAADHQGVYAGSVSDLDGYATTRGVTVTIEECGRKGWRATAKHTQLAGVRCEIRVWAGAVMDAEITVCRADVYGSCPRAN